MATENTGRFECIVNTHNTFFAEDIPKEEFFARKVSYRIKQMMNRYVSEIDTTIEMINRNLDQYTLSKQISMLKHLSRSQNVAVKKLLDYISRLP